MASRTGASLYSLLTSLHHPAAASLSPEALDWVCEAPGCEDFIDWLLASVSRDNVLEDAELEAYAAIPKEERLSGRILSEALSSLGVTDGQRMTDAELERQISVMEAELSTMELSRDKLEALCETSEAAMSSSLTGSSHLDHLKDRLQVEEKRAQEEVIQINNQFNKVVEALQDSAIAVSNMYESASEDQEKPIFIASIDLNKIQEADAALDHELQVLMDVYFTKKLEMDAGGGCGPLDQLRGRNQAEYEELVSEMARLRTSWVHQELRRIKLLAREAALTAALAAGSKETELSKMSLEEMAEAREDVEAEIARTLEKVADLDLQNILDIDCRNKEARNSTVIKNLEEIKDILLQQVAKREILAILVNKEKEEVTDLESTLREVIKCFKDQATQLNNFKTAMKSLASKRSESEADLIPVEDVVMTRIHQILYSRNLVGHHPTYKQVFEAMTNLEERKNDLEKQIQTRKTANMEDFQTASKRISKIFSHLEVNETSGSSIVSVGPSSIKTGIAQVDKVMYDIKDKCKQVSDSWEVNVKEMKTKPEATVVRDIWVDFLVKPKSLIANMKNLEIKANR